MLPSLALPSSKLTQHRKQTSCIGHWLVTRIISIQCSTLYFWPIKVFIMDAAAVGLTSDQKNNIKYSTRLKVFYHLNIGKGIMLLDSDRRRTVRQETVRDTAAVAEYFHFMKPESPFLNAIVLSPFSRRWRAERSPGWWYHYVDIALCSAALRSMYDCVVIASVKNTKLSPQKLAEAHHFFYLPPFLEKQKENSGAQKYFWHCTSHSALQFCNDLFTELPHLVTSSFFPIMCIVHGCSSYMRLCDHKTTVL